MLIIISGTLKGEIRTSFNKKFKTIMKGVAKEEEASTTGIGLDYSYSTVDGISVAKLNTIHQSNKNSEGKQYPIKISEKNLVVMGKIADSFKMTAVSGIYTVTNKYVNLGIVKRGVDLNLKTDLVNAEVNVNGETTVYQYDQIGENGDVTLGENVTSDQIKYKAVIEESDYNYRISSYEAITVDASLTGDNLDKELVKDVAIEKLNIIATYKIELNNNSTANAKVNSINYYYDANYTYIKNSATYKEYNSTGNEDLGSITITEDSNITTIGGHNYKKLTIENLSSATLNGGKQNIITLKFSVNAKTSKTLLETGDFMCIGEITSYSTDQGYVDDDSAPDNCLKDLDEKGEGEVWFEDDTDKAGTLTITVATESQREIRGFVFEDSKTENTNGTLDDKNYTYSAGDGKYDSENEDETKVNGVIVQLVEKVIMPYKKEGSTVFYYDESLLPEEINKGIANGTYNSEVVKIGDMATAEYIWQETVSGSGIVRRISYDGESIETYDLKDYGISVERGEYAFKDYIPGVYIIRFIYGDGDTIESEYTNYPYSLESEESSKFYTEKEDNSEKIYSILKEVNEYNGQAYKSTTDVTYENEWLVFSKASEEKWVPTIKDSNSKLIPASVARDNEARRLETIIEIAKLTQKEKTPTLTEVSGLIRVTHEYPTSNVLKNCWMCAETSKINVHVFMNNSYYDDKTENGNYKEFKNNVTGTSSIKKDASGNDIWVKDNTSQKFENINFGLEKRPTNVIWLEKHIESLKIILQTGQEIVNVNIDLEDYYNGKKQISEMDRIGISKGLSIIGAEKNVDEGFWHVDVDDELLQGARAELVYRYSVEIKGEQDYLSVDLANAYAEKSDEDYLNYLSDKIKEIKKASYWDRTERTKYNNIPDYFIGKYLGSTYYTGVLDLGNDVNDHSKVKPVSVQVKTIVDYVNNSLTFVSDEAEQRNMAEVDDDDKYFPHGGNYLYPLKDSEAKIQWIEQHTILRSTKPSERLYVGEIDSKYSAKFVIEGLSATGVLEFPAYYVQVTSYITPTGRITEDCERYLPYVYSYVTGQYTTPDGSPEEEEPLEPDESGAEKLLLVKPTGEDEMTKLILAITITAGVVIVAGGVFAIKKYVIR